MESLELLESAYGARDVLELRKREVIDQVITPEIKARLAEIDEEFFGDEQSIAEEIDRLEGQVKAEVAKLGETVKGKMVQAVWTKGRVSWDTKALDGFAAAYPDLLKFRKEGEPSVSLRVVGKK